MVVLIVKTELIPNHAHEEVLNLALPAKRRAWMNGYRDGRIFYCIIWVFVLLGNCQHLKAIEIPLRSQKGRENTSRYSLAC